MLYALEAYMRGLSLLSWPLSLTSFLFTFFRYFMLHIGFFLRIRPSWVAPSRRRQHISIRLRLVNRASFLLELQTGVPRRPRPVLDMKPLLAGP
jgi:hypothetical protein